MSEKEVREALPIMLRDAGCEPGDCYTQDEHDNFTDAGTEYYSKANGHVQALMWKLQSNNVHSVKVTGDGFEHYFDTKLFVDMYSHVGAQQLQGVERLVRRCGPDMD